jgi:phenylpropionate dioxygenase-like ring-hydroxylating dioxygenase large terminal subunit
MMASDRGEPETGAGPRPVPYRITEPDRVPARRYYDPEFYALECERLWPRVWQMACRLEEIPRRGDFVVYEILDQSVIVTRVDEKTVKAYHNACRHRGVRLARDRGSCPDGFVCPFHGWKYSLNGNCTFVLSPELFDRRNLERGDLALRECRVELWGGCAFINLDDAAPPLRDSIEPFAAMHDAWHVESLRTEWWLAARLPVNWKLAMEAFMEGYHVMATHPQLLPPGSPPPGPDWAYARVSSANASALHYATARKGPPPASVDARDFIELNIHAMRVLSEGMAGMTHAKDVRVAEGLRGTELPSDLPSALVAWRRTLNDAVVRHHREHGMDVPDLNDVDAKGWGTAVNFCFPNYFLLPMYGSSSSYRIRPLGPEECLFDLWSLTRYPPGEEPPPIRTPTPMAPDDPRWPPIPTQDFSNLPLQQRGLHAKGFEYMRLSNQMEGLISNYQRLIDGYLAGLDYDRLLPAAHKVCGCIDAPIADLGL